MDLVRLEAVGVRSVPVPGHSVELVEILVIDSELEAVGHPLGGPSPDLVGRNVNSEGEPLAKNQSLTAMSQLVRHGIRPEGDAAPGRSV